MYWSSETVDGNITLQRATMNGTDIQILAETSMGFSRFIDISIDENSGYVYLKNVCLCKPLNIRMVVSKKSAAVTQVMLQCTECKKERYKNSR